MLWVAGVRLGWPKTLVNGHRLPGLASVRCRRYDRGVEARQAADYFGAHLQPQERAAVPVATATRRPARPPRRTRPPAPPLDLVARAALDLPPGDVLAFLRSTVNVGDRLRKLEALRHFDKLGAPTGELEVLSVTDRERAAARAVGVGERTVRRWRTGS